MSDIQVHGDVEPGFEAVADAFEANFRVGGDRGAACAVYVEGRKVVDLWGGLADEESGRPWEQDTLSLIWSATKGPASMLVLLLAERGLIDLDAPLATYWPEFATNGKERVTVRHVLSHTAGVPYVDAPITKAELIEGTAVVRALEQQPLAWEPGTKHGYHGITFGFLVGELVRRVTGNTLGTVFAEEVAGPFGLDFHIGLPPALEDRVTTLIPTDQGDPDALDLMPTQELKDLGLQFAIGLMTPGTTAFKALMVGLFDVPEMNLPEVHQAEWPFGNGITDARSLARVYAACVGDGVDGRRLLSQEMVDDAIRPLTSGSDEVLVYPVTWSSGFIRPNEMASFLGPRSFAFSGAGGHLGFGDPDAHVGFGFTMTKMFGNLVGDPRPGSVLEALKTCL